MAIYIHKKARYDFKLSGKPMNGNVFENKASLSRLAFALIFDLFPCLRTTLTEIAVYT